MRGSRLFDTDKTKRMVKERTAWYRRHRAILESDIIHLRRADGRDIDYMMHVNPAIKEKGLLMVFNPLDKAVSKILKVPLYYTGIDESVKVTDRAGKTIRVKLNRDYSVDLKVSVPVNGASWYIFE